ncbi:endonuclease III domain-containing protein [Halorubrum vacuolatum]|uniref:Endonuclease-3 n=1 Tax=Halorubrum vacuolatum TaxID=63740 RepID=A0A238W3Z1_HALVU|nr:endonuclease III [Halorubrum vacuolatum]SNR41272.1 endonuclease-3 [Halorubrum vacuolatum]
MPDEPDVNISGGPGGGGRELDIATAGDDGDGPTRAARVVDALGDRYWRKAYGGQDGFECLVRTILSQNTSDVASQPAHDALMERYGPAEGLAERLAGADREELAEVIAAAGLYNQKSRVIIEAAEWACGEFGSTTAFDDYVADGDPSEVRETLLSISGVGPKTADCVLLFAGGRDGVFPVDTHVHRIARRMGLAPPEADHEGVREAIEAAVPPAACGFGHTAMIQFGREYCTARKPACLDGPEACLDGPEACPLYSLCDRVGVDPEAGTVVDPAETVDG